MSRHQSEVEPQKLQEPADCGSDSSQSFLTGLRPNRVELKTQIVIPQIPETRWFRVEPLSYADEA